MLGAKRVMGEQELKELADVSASFDIRPRRRFQYLAMFLALLSLIFSIVGETKIYSEVDHKKFCAGEIDSSGAGTWATVALLLLIAGFTMVIAGPNECCNAVICKRYGLKTFNAGLYLMLGWVFFAFAVCCLYFGAVRELNHDCPKAFEDSYEVIVDGFIVAGGVCGFIATSFATLYYGDSMTLAGLQAEKGLLTAKRKIIAGNADGAPECVRLLVDAGARVDTRHRAARSLYGGRGLGHLSNLRWRRSETLRLQVPPRVYFKYKLQYK